MILPYNLKKNIKISVIALKYSQNFHWLSLLSANQALLIRPRLGIHIIKSFVQLVGIDVDLNDNLYDTFNNENLNKTKYDMLSFYLKRASVTKIINIFFNNVITTMLDFHPLLYLKGNKIVGTIDKDLYFKLSDSKIKKMCIKAALEYYLFHLQILNVLIYIVKHNLGLLLNLSIINRYIFRYFSQIIKKSTAGKYCNKNERLK